MFFWDTVYMCAGAIAASLAAARPMFGRMFGPKFSPTIFDQSISQSN